MDSELDFHAAKALLEWQVELGATDAIGDVPVDRYGLAETTAPKSQALSPAVDPARIARPTEVDPAVVAEAAASGASSLNALRVAMEAFEHCELKKGARNLVFSDGVPGSRVMIIGEAPGRDEDQAGKPFVGRAGQLLDRMLVAIGLGRDATVYITNVLPWRPPQNREPRPEEIAMLKPFLMRHIALAGPEVIVLMGNTSCDAMLGKRGITKLRGQWTQAAGRPALPMFHPAYLLRQPGSKREAWADLLELKARLFND